MVTIGMQGEMNTPVNYQIRLVSKDWVNARVLGKNSCFIYDKLVKPITRED